MTAAAITKVKKFTNPKCSIIQDFDTENSFAFLVDSSQLPKSAVVDRVRLMGSFEHNKKEIKDIILDNIPESYVKYHPDFIDGNDRVVATICFPNGIPEDLRLKVLSCEITDFKVYYHEEAIIEE